MIYGNKLFVIVEDKMLPFYQLNFIKLKSKEEVKLRERSYGQPLNF